MRLIEYRQGYINCSREKLIEDMSKVLSKERLNHCIRVEQYALELAESRDEWIDLEKVSISALMHDYAKELQVDVMKELALRYSQIKGIESAGVAIWHGFAAATIAKENYECRDESIIKAIGSHTIGSDDMDIVAQLVFVADYCEPNRQFEGVKKARQLAHEDLFQAVIYKMAESLRHLLSQRKEIFEFSLTVYNAWIRKMEEL